MISVNFLKQPSNITGLEFLDFQNNTFAKELTEVLEDCIDSKGIIEEAGLELLPTVIGRHTGFNNITTEVMDFVNVGIDAGYLSPNNVLNNQGLDAYFSHTKTTLYRYFQESKNNLFKGTIDYATGKVGGSFSELPLTIYIGKDIRSLISAKFLTKYNVTLAEGLAAIIGHELGHAFGACMMMSVAVESNIMAQSAIRAYKNATTKEERVLVVKDVGKLLDIKKQDQKEIEAIAKSDSEEGLVLYYSKLLKQRNDNRALSLGVPVMTSEVVADAYSVRMGFTKGMIAVVADLTKGGFIRKFGMSFISIVPLALAGLSIAGTHIGAIAIWAGLVTLGAVLVYLGTNYAGIYNSDPRRLDDVIRTSIMKLKEDKKLTSKDKSELINILVKAKEQLDNITPFYDNTIVERMVGYVFHGGDYAKLNIEHFSQKLANHEINVLSHRLQNV